MEGAAEHSVTVKPIDRFISYLGELETHLQQSAGPLSIGVVGADAAGVELILALKQRFETFSTPDGAGRVHLHLLDRAPVFLRSGKARRWLKISAGPLRARLSALALT